MRDVMKKFREDTLPSSDINFKEVIELLEDGTFYGKKHD